MSSYVAIRDDSGLKSLSVNERDFLRSCALSSSTNDDDEQNTNKILRCDGRKANDIRKVRLKLGRWDNGSECTVQWGAGTRVTSLCSAELVPPSSPDRPAEGMVNFSVDLSPMACPAFRLAPPVGTAPPGSSTTNTSYIRGPNFADSNQRLLTNRILRCLERVVLIGGALDTEALVVVPGKWVWRLNVSLTVLDQGGNILDACVLAAIAALRHYRKPQVDLSGQEGDDDINDTTSTNKKDIPILPTLIPSIVKEATPLPLHHTPLSISFALIPADDASGKTTSSSSSSIVAALIDPTDREELIQFGTLTIAMNIHSEVCLLDYGGGCEITPTKLKQSWNVAKHSIHSLCRILEDCLKEADTQAQQERLLKLQKQQQQEQQQLPPLPPIGHDSDTPFFQQTTNEDMDDVLTSQHQSTDIDQIQTAQTEAEEAYRLQALDYSKGHMPTAVRENNDSSTKSSPFEVQAGSLLAAMLKSVKADAVVENQTQEEQQEQKLSLPPKPMMVDPPSTTTTAAATASASPKPIVNVTKQDERPRTINKPDVQKDRDTGKKATTTTDSSAPMDIGDDDEEEETTTVLQSEFQSVVPTTSKKSPPPPAVTQQEEIKEEDITDFSMAIKKKKSSKKKSKKKK